ncbi:MAG: cytochrome b561 domain-containing protein [Pseudomonadota bacterium]
MMEWLWAPIDAARGHEVGFAISWHGRTMVLAWGILAPLAVMAARFFKVLPWQHWPRELDSQLWWRSHWLGQSAVLLLTVFGIGLVLDGKLGDSLHGRLGYAVLVLTLAQIALGVFRGSKGGPTAPAADGSLHGDHYDMTPWRLMFELVHKSTGYALLALAGVTIVLGLWDANAPRWMWIGLAGWWIALAGLSLTLQRKGHAVDTYQAIWGPGEEHPGNQRKSAGWGMRRRPMTEGEHVRSD